MLYAVIKCLHILAMAVWIGAAACRWWQGQL
jgi:hypothetical protein